MALVWFVLDAFTHLTIEASYVWVTWFYGGAENTDSFLAMPWKEYGRADVRWARFDPTVLTLELITVLGENIWAELG